MSKSCTLEYFDLAKVSEVYGFHRRETHGAEWGIKGHNLPWILEQGQWESASTGLDVGAAYSDLPAHIIEAYDVEVWAADDFGMDSGEPIWHRGSKPETVLSRFPNVKYVFQRLGNIESTDYPHSYFDRIYSVSVLEHIPPLHMPQVFDHMIALLKPGGMLLHTVDMRKRLSRANIVGLIRLFAQDLKD